MKLTWLGHSAFHFAAQGKNVLIDPFITGNSMAPDNAAPWLANIDILLLTHAHGDHVGDALDIIKANDPTVVCIFEVANWLKANGANPDKIIDMNIGGTVDLPGGLKVTMVNAVHSSSLPDGSYGGQPAGMILNTGDHRIYHTGDTDVFSDMALIQTLHNPDIALMPIGDRYTMTPRTAAYACNELLDVDIVVPMHWDTFPVLTGKPEDFKAQVKRGRVEILTPGEPLEL
ncbi:MAG: metal-dependent hydrolase [Rhodospirillales bacterium]|nr:metal-dependent hydrolase [Rhodospirillales bacterium]